MALCRARISSEGPVMREVPVSTMAAQPWAQRVSPVPTCTLCGGRIQSSEPRVQVPSSLPQKTMEPGLGPRLPGLRDRDPHRSMWICQ